MAYSLKGRVFPYKALLFRFKYDKIDTLIKKHDERQHEV